MKKSASINEVTPGLNPVDKTILDEALAGSIGATTVVAESGRELGAVHLGGVNAATVVVEMVGVSRGSGGELYKPVSVHTADADHYIIDALPEPPIVLHPL